MRKTVLINLCLFLLLPSLSGAKVRDKDLKYVMPSADSFKLHKEKLLLYEAFSKKELVGFCFLTTDIVTNSTGYNGPLVILVGLYKNGVISGIKVLRHRENIKEAFDIEKPEFGSQFIGKKLSDKFLVNEDVNNITGATVTVKKLARIVKKSSEKVLNFYFPQMHLVKNSKVQEEEEEEILNPKGPVQKISRDIIKSSKLSEKEAEFYEKK